MENENIENVVEETTPKEVENVVEKEPQQANKSNTKQVLQVYSGHLGSILSNIAIFFTILSIALAFSVILVAFGMMLSAVLAVIMVFVILLSIGTIFAFFPDWMEKIEKVATIFSDGDFTENLIMYCIKLWPIFTSVAIGSSILSVVFLALDKTQSHKKRIVTGVTTIVLAVIVIVLFAIGMVGGNK